jgi:hypothetical protein
MGHGGVLDEGLLDSDNYWEWTTRIEDLLVHHQPCKMSIALEDGSKVQATGVCNVVMQTKVCKTMRTITLSEVLIVPKVPYNLLSLGARESMWSARVQEE